MGVTGVGGVCVMIIGPAIVWVTTRVVMDDDDSSSGVEWGGAAN